MLILIVGNVTNDINILNHLKDYNWIVCGKRGVLMSLQNLEVVTSVKQVF